MDERNFAQEMMSLNNNMHDSKLGIGSLGMEINYAKK
jgi:hypothetical protein